MLSFVVHTNPRPAPRPRFGQGRAYMPSAYKSYLKLIREAALCAMPANWDVSGQFALDIRSYRKDAVEADWDNLAKPVADALNKLAFWDDRQIVDGRCRKFTRDPNPRLEVTLTRVG